MRYLLPKKPQYKVNLHCHSTFSDGQCSPEELKKLYCEKGYSAVAFTDHDGLFFHNELTDDHFVALAGFELEFTEENPDAANWIQNKTCHICAIAKKSTPVPQPGFDPDFCHPSFRWSVEEEKRKLILRDESKPFSKEYSPENISSVIQTLTEKGFWVQYNHPRWSVESYPEFIGYKGLCGVELHNYGCFVEGYDEYNGDVYDALLKSGQRLTAVATDDNHHAPDSPHADMFGGFTMIAAEELSYRAIIEALERGDCYASTGPILTELSAEKTAEDNVNIRLVTETSVDYIRMVTDVRIAGIRYHANGQKITEANFSFDPRLVRYVRFEVGDGIRRAYTRAYFTDCDME